MNLQILNLDQLPTPLAGVERSAAGLVDSGAEIIPPANKTIPDFHGVREPKLVIQKEKEAHRIMAWMFASGASVKTVAFETGYSEQQVSLIHRQPWFRANVQQFIQNEMGDDIGKMLRAAAVEGLMVIRDIANNATKDSDRLKAAQDLLDRHRGKATNFVHHTSGNLSEDPAAELKRLEQELLE